MTSILSQVQVITVVAAFLDDIVVTLNSLTGAPETGTPEILQLATASASIRSCMNAAKSRVPMELVPGHGICGLWNHLEFRDVALHVQRCADLEVHSSVKGTHIFDTGELAKFLAALDIVRRPTDDLAARWPHGPVSAVAFRFPQCSDVLSWNLAVTWSDPNRIWLILNQD